MKNLFTLLIICFPLFAFSKNEGFSVKGKVLDVNSEPLAYVNILLINPVDSSLIKGSVTNESGEFLLEDIDTGSYRIMVSYIGYKKYYSEVFTLDPSNKDFVSADIILETSSETLDEFAVVAQKPFIERHLDKLVVNVENSIISAGNTALEVLKRSPGVIVDQDGNISLKGKSGVMIMIDGKQSYLSSEDVTNMLKTMSADQIEKIEIITNPSAKYDAAGNAGIINIVMKKNQMLGLNGSLNAGYSQWRYAGYNGGLNLNYRIEKWNFFASYNYGNRNDYSDFNMDRNFRTGDTISTIFNQKKSSYNHNETHSGKFAVDFYPNKKHTIGFFVNGMQNSGIDRGSNTSLINDGNDLLVSYSETADNNSSAWGNVSGNFNYNWKIDTNGVELTVNLDYGKFNSDQNQLYTTNYFNSTNDPMGIPYILRSDLPSNIEIMSGKLDYVHPIGKKMRIEGGVKASHVFTDNNAQFWYLDNGAEVVDTGKTNHFLYTEQINAAYANFLMEINDKFSFQLGLRAEQTISKGELITYDSIFKRNYTNLFPSAFVSYKISKNHDLNFNYSRRINRPDYESLNPFIYFLDPYSYMQGNTLLQPEYANSFELTHTFMGFLSTTVSFSRNSGVMTDVTTQNDSTFTTFATKQNLNTLDNFSISTMLPIPITKWWTSMNFLTLYNSRYRGEIQGGQFDKSATAFMIHSQNMFNFKKGWSAEISAFYMTKQVYGIFLMYPMSNVTLGIQKSFAKEKASLKVSLSDIFWMSRFRGDVQYQNMDLHIDTRNMSRVFSVNFSWKFGNSKAQAREKQSGASDEMDRVKGGG